MPKPKQFDYYKLYRDGDEFGEAFTVKGFDTYPRSSVLAGQTRITWLDTFATEAEARKAFPQLANDGSEWSSKLMDPVASVSPYPPSDFDPYYAGERWDDDY